MYEESISSMHTAIEYIDTELLQQRKFPTTLSRDELRAAIYKKKMAEEGAVEGDADFYSIVVRYNFF